ncbi:MAG TPA: hypothetical protein PK967_20065 [Candidatus Hydrogenedentes bacterium]|nr:hypothetical protein [Candidatus Hydrogenedentota bacterium]
MIEVKNLLFQPLSLHTQSGRGLHMGPREVLRLPDDEMSAEMEAASRRGAVSLTTLDDSAATEAPQLIDTPNEPQTEAVLRGHLGFGSGQVSPAPDAARTARKKRS